jgi:hypothetical protein
MARFPESGRVASKGPQPPFPRFRSFMCGAIEVGANIPIAAKDLRHSRHVVFLRRDFIGANPQCGNSVYSFPFRFCRAD